MTILISPYNPDWQNQFASIRDKIEPSIKDLIVSIEHVGSTAVEGLAAKPVIDIDVIYKENLAEITKRLESIGYVHQGDKGIEHREAFKTSSSPPHHLYVCLDGSLALKNHLLLRDHLRKNPLDRDAYGKLKTELAEKFKNDVAGYVEAKTDFIIKILENYGLETQSIKRSNSSKQNFP